MPPTERYYASYNIVMLVILTEHTTPRIDILVPGTTSKFSRYLKIGSDVNLTLSSSVGNTISFFFPLKGDTGIY